MFFYLVLTVTVVVMDQSLKFIVRQFPEQTVLFRLGHWVFFTRTTNTGMAFSLLNAYPALIRILTLACTALLIVLFRQLKTRNEKIFFAIVTGGALGNLTDRFFFDGVTDYISFSFLPQIVFNFADICIVLGFFAMLVCTFFSKKEETLRRKNGNSNASSGS